MAEFFTIGYGKLEWDKFARLLLRHEIDTLVDVRSRPYSRVPEYRREALHGALKRLQMNYLFMGSSLGGRPENPDCYEKNGQVNYTWLSETASYKRGITRLLHHAGPSQRIALLCSESKPQDCHRSKLLGMTLHAAGIDIGHIHHDGRCISHELLIEDLIGGQSTLGGEPMTLRSRGKYR